MLVFREGKWGSLKAGQIIAKLTRRGPSNGSVLEGKWDPLFQGNLVW